MSIHSDKKSITTTHIRAQKKKTPLVGLTAYTASLAKAMDPHVDLILVGDSVAMTIYGKDSTLGVSVETMIRHGEAVARSCRYACVVVDLPFGSYQRSPEQAFDTASRIMNETGCAAIKLEGGQEMAPTVEFLSLRGVPVLGHVGLTPQAINVLGGFRTQGKDDAAAQRLRADTISMENAGAFAVVIEGVVESLAREMTESVSIPTIGIGASPACDGQILVIDDVIGLFTAFKPRFVKRYANVIDVAEAAIAEYAKEVRERQFPTDEHIFKG
jgi:3-methyl-2-oxobutanoate hydroxymethyltransferase